MRAWRASRWALFIAEALVQIRPANNRPMPSTPNLARAVIFDMDGVLILSGDAHFDSWRDAAAARGIELTCQLFNETFGRTNPDCIRMIFGEGIPELEQRAIAEAKEANYRDAIRGRVPLAPGAVELLDLLRSRGIKLAIGSSAPRANLDQIVDEGRIRHYFGAIVDGSQVKRGKPAPDVFLQAAAGLGVEPALCTVIEDAPPGIEAALAAGMRAVGVATTHAASELREVGAHMTVGELSALARGPAMLGM